MALDFTKSNEENLTYLNEVIQIPTGEKLRFNDIEKAFPNKGYLALTANTVRAAAQADVEAQIVFNAASNGGADLSSVHAQEKVRALAYAAKWPQELTDWILSRSLWTGPRWKHLGMQEPTLEWIQTQRDHYELQQNKDKIREDYDKLREQWIAAYQTGLKWVNEQQDANKPAPEFVDILLELRG